MVLLEVNVSVYDPQKRYLDLKDIIGYETKWKLENDGRLKTHASMAWIGWHSRKTSQRLNALGLKNERGNSFTVLSDEEFRRQMWASCTIF